MDCFLYDNGLGHERVKVLFLQLKTYKDELDFDFFLTILGRCNEN